MRTDAPSALELTRRVVAGASVPDDASVTAAMPAHLASERAFRALRRSLGVTGFHALLTRALHDAAGKHPLLEAVRVRHDDGNILGGVAELVDIHGAKSVEEALEDVLTTLFGLLGRLMGDDMVPRLVEPRPQDDSHGSQEGK